MNEPINLSEKIVPKRVPSLSSPFMNSLDEIALSPRPMSGENNEIIAT